MLTAGKPVHENGRTDEEEDQGKKELDGQNVNRESEHGNKESDEIIEKTEEKAGVNQLGVTDENPNGEIDENEEEVRQKEVDGQNGNQESNEKMEETEEQAEGNQLGETDENTTGEIVENEEKNCKKEEEEEKERRRRAIKQGKRPMYKEGGPFKDYEGKNKGREFDFDKWS